MTPRIKRLLELISSYSFNLYYMKGKDMILSDFLSRQMHDNSNPHEIIPISFNMYNALYETYYRIEMKDWYLVQTSLQMKVAAIILPEVHGTQKAITIESPKPQTPVKQVDKNRPKLGYGRAGIKCKKPQPVADKWTSSKSSKIPTVQNATKNSTNFPVPDWLITNKTEIVIRREIQGKNMDQPFYPDPIYRPPPRPPENLLPESPENKLVTDPKIDIEFEENSLHQEGIISEFYQRPNISYLQQPKDLENLVNTGNLVQKLLPKQADIDKILKIIQQKVLKGTYLSVTVKEIQAGYLCSSYFKDIYLYLAQNKLPSSKTAIRKIEMLAEKYILLDSLFKISTTPDRETAVLPIPETCIDSIIALIHLSLFARHQGIIKTYLTISDKFFIPNLIHYLRSYIKGCHICQLNRNEKPPSKQLKTRINLNYRPLSRLSMNLKVMPKLSKGHKYILCLIDKATNYLITVSVYQSKAEEIGEALIEHVITKYCVPDCIIMDQDSAFMSSLMNYLFNKFNIKIDSCTLQPSIVASQIWN